MKRLHKLLIKSFIKPLIATFFVAQFILILQFLWQHIEDLAGKGLGADIIAELLLYASASLVPLALPLAILLSSIMTFGNLGEYLELTAVKSSGISLQKFMRPLIILVSILAIGAFFYANHVIPYANLKALSLRYDIKQQREELNIREGVFYNDIEGYSIKVGHKDPKTKLMKNIMIYEHDKNQGNAQVTVADSGYIKMTSDESKLLVTLYNGHTYAEMQESNKSKPRGEEKQYPFQQRKFDKETLLIDISGFNFQRTDEGLFKDNYQMLKLSELEKNRDSLIRVYNEKARSLSRELDDNLFDSEEFSKQASNRNPDKQQSPGKDKPTKTPPGPGPNNETSDNKNSGVSNEAPLPHMYAKDSIAPESQQAYVYTFSDSPDSASENSVTRRPLSDRQYAGLQRNDSPPNSPENAKKQNIKSNNITQTLDVDTLMDTLETRHKLNIINQALRNARQNSQKITESKKIFEQRLKNIYKHQIHWHKKLTLSFACIIFFFIGAPLGSIIRKGGLGTPLVISVIFFIIYYIVSITGENFVEKGVFPAFIGMWLSSLIFLPIGIFLTYKATNDSMILDTETYKKIVKKIFPFGLGNNGNTGENERGDFHEQ
ncbi:MAG: LptF/LptG family permease [Bacteroidales bacterium]|nr:LptF/LptG family permease [Bacteroidales bacterium]